MSKTNIYIFKGLYIIAWLIFVGLSIEAGALIVNFIVTMYNPDFVDNLYQKLNLRAMYESNKWVFFGVYSFILFVSILKAYLFYLLIKLLSNFNLTKPFNDSVSNQITQISYLTFSIGLISYIARQTTKSQQHHGYVVDGLEQFWGDSQAYILMAAVIFVIASIFKRGVEIQTENELTV